MNSTILKIVGALALWQSSLRTSRNYNIYIVMKQSCSLNNSVLWYRLPAAAQRNAFHCLTFVILLRANKAEHCTVGHEQRHPLTIESALPTGSGEEEIQLPPINVNIGLAPAAEKRGRDNSSCSRLVLSLSAPDVVNLPFLHKAKFVPPAA